MSGKPIFTVQDNWNHPTWFASYGDQMRPIFFPSLKQLLITDDNHNYVSISWDKQGWLVHWQVTYLHQTVFDQRTNSYSFFQEYVSGQRIYTPDYLERAFKLREYNLKRLERKALSHFRTFSDGVPGYFVRLGRLLNLPDRGVSIRISVEMSMAVKELLQDSK